uniref:Secreted protein n=1 Tax=Thraustotheca clavata TaxID=74557 RepID=A0A0A7CMS4_9STRA|nr:secreted protein [Thraustotheca clavata]
MFSIFFAILIATAVVAVPCTSTQKQQMLNVITADPQWSTCKAATTPYDFYTSLTQGGPPPTTTQNDLFNSTPACTSVYDHFQDSLKQANCDQIQNLIGIPYTQFISLTMGTPSTTAPVAHSNVANPNTIITFAPNPSPSSISPNEKDQITLVKSSAAIMNYQVFATL